MNCDSPNLRRARAAGPLGPHSRTATAAVIRRRSLDGGNSDLQRPSRVSTAGGGALRAPLTAPINRKGLFSRDRRRIAAAKERGAASQRALSVSPLGDGSRTPLNWRLSARSARNVQLDVEFSARIVWRNRHKPVGAMSVMAWGGAGGPPFCG